MTDIKPTAHARQRMAEMGVTRRDLRAVITSPEVVWPGTQTRDKHGRATRNGNPCENRRMFVAGRVAVVADRHPTLDRWDVITVLHRTADVYERADPGADPVE